MGREGGLSRALRLPAVLAFAAAAGALTYGFGGDARQALAAGLALAALGCWATGALADYVAALAFFAVASITAVAPPAVIFSGFSSSALWLVFGGLVLGVAVERTGVAAWISGVLVGRVGRTYPRVIASIVIGATALGFLVPSSMARAVIFIPIVASLADELGLAPGHRGRVGMLVAAALATYLVPATILPANLANALLLGAADTLYDLELGYGPYLLAHFPVLGALKGVTILLVVWFLFRSPMPGRPAAPGRTARLSREGRRCLVLLLAALTLWVTDTWHGISPGWVSLGAGLVCLLPHVELVPPESFVREVSLGTVLFVAGVLGVGAVVGHSGVGELVAGGALERLALDAERPARSFAWLSGLAIGLATFATMPGLVAILAPLAEQTAASSGIALTSVLMTIVIGYSSVALPYQALPLLFAFKLARVSFADSARATLWVFAGTLLVLLPLDYLWWRWLGLI